MGLEGVEIVMSVEEAFDIVIHNAEAEKMPTPRDIIECVLRKDYVPCHEDFKGTVSGYYCRPKEAKPKSLPIVLLVHGAGVHSAQLNSAAYWCKNGVLAMDINAHGIPNGQPAEFYKELEQGTLKGYPAFGRDSRETCYFLGMFLRELRALDFLCSQPEWDGKMSSFRDPARAASRPSLLRDLICA